MMTHLSLLPFSMSLTSSLMEIRALTKRSSSACSNTGLKDTFGAFEHILLTGEGERSSHSSSHCTHFSRQSAQLSVFPKGWHCQHQVSTT